MSSEENTCACTSEQMISWCSSWPEVQIASYSLSLREGILACSSASQETILTATSIILAIQYFCIHSKTRQKNP